MTDEALQHRAKVLARLVALSQELSSTQPLDELLANIMETAADITEAEGASVLLWNAQQQALFFAATTGNSPQNLIGQMVPLNGSLAGTIYRERRVVEVNNVEQDPRHYTQTDQQVKFETRSLLGVPMVARSRVLGVLEVVNKRQLPWTEHDREYLLALASQAAVAIEGAQLLVSLRRANEELAEVDKLKNDFIAIASHELRTPLGIILGYASFLQEETDPDDSTRAHVDKVLSGALQLRKIMEDLTNLRYLQQNAAEFMFAPVPLSAVVNDVRAEVIGTMQARGQTLVLQLPDTPLTVRADKQRLGMALTNVVNNALEFTPEGGRILIEARERDGQTYICVQDEGPGVPPDKLKRIFEKFYQVEHHLVRRHQGLGLGLSITRAIVEAHGGRAWAENGADGGLAVTLAIPNS